jgi:hypothetical protein
MPANLSVMSRLGVILMLIVSSAGCRAIEGIFKAGVWVGVVIAVIVIGLLFAVFGRSSA